MSTYSIVGPPAKTYYSRSGPVTSGYPLSEEYGSKGSIPRKKPAGNPILSLTGHSARSTKIVYVGGSPPPPVPLNPGMDYVLFAPAQTLGCGTPPTTGLISASQKQSIKDELELRVRAKIKNVGWNAATSVAELRETTSFLATTVKEVYDYYRLARKGDFLRLSELYRQRDQRGKRYPKWPARVTNRYLAYRFAVRPLIKDLDDALHHFYRSDLKPVVCTARARGRTSAHQVTFDLYQGNPGLKRTFVTDEHWEATRCVYFQVTPEVAKWKSLGLTNLAAVLWEVTPYSFMVDRLLPVGQFIGSLDAMAGVTVIGDYLSERTSGDGLVACLAAFSKAELRNYSRSVNLGVGYPIPSFKPNVDAGYFTDALALLYALKTRGPVKGF